jgi:hypothetical protein
MVVAMERPCKHHATAGYCGDRGNAEIMELWEEVLSVRSVPRLCYLGSFDVQFCGGG